MTLPAFVIEAKRVDDGEKTTSESGRDHLIENRKRIGAGIQIVLTAADDGPEAVGGNDLFGPEVLLSPGALARTRGPTRTTRAGSGIGSIRILRILSERFEFR